MLRMRSFSVLCAVTLLVIILAVAVHRDSGAIPRSGESLFPGLLSSINEVKRIRASSGNKSFTLERRGNAWVVADRFGYPANADKVHSLLVGAAGLKRIEPKTRKPELYSKLGLGDGNEGASRAVAFALEGANGKELASWITGNAAPAKGDPEASEIYVRLPEDPQTWLVEGKVPRDGALVDWLDQTILNIDRKRVRLVRVVHQDGEVVVVSKETFDENDFALADMPADTDVNGQWRINDIGRAFTNLELADVRPRDSLPESSSPNFRVTMQTFDGLEVNLSLHQIDGQSICAISVLFDENLRHSSEARSSAQEVREEAAALQDALKNWVFVLPEFKADHLAQKREALLKEKGAKEEASSG